MSLPAMYEENLRNLDQWTAIQNRLPEGEVTPLSTKVFQEISKIKQNLIMLDDRDSGYCDDIEH